jgi:catalase
VHAKGAGAFGEFEVTHDISDFTSANVFNGIGKKTKLFARFSTVAGGRGSADTVRDTRGFAFKMYTEEGNLDWLFFSEPVFPIRDGAKFPSFVHAQKGVPQNNLFSSTAFWDFFNHNAEAFHALMMIFSDRGTPQSYQASEIYGLNTYKFTKKDGSFFYTKIHLKPKGGVKNFHREKATELAGSDPDFTSRALFDAIESGDFPEWTVYAQIIPPQEAAGYKTNIFDPTKTISQKDFPLIPFGKITLNKNTTNFFSEVEGVSFSPTAIVPGWDVTADPILQTRLFAYGSAARYRLGVNFYQSQINRPLYQYNPTKRDGAGVVDNLGSLPNYIPGDAEVETIVTADQYEVQEHEEWVGKVTAFDSKVTAADFVQPREFWLGTLGSDPAQQERLVGNVAASLSKAAKEVREVTYGMYMSFERVDVGSSIC